jgi:ribosomal protein S18 acetylase RimI-like enzyme
MAFYNIRPAALADEPFLCEMLYEAIYVPVGEQAPPRSIVAHPDVARYLAGWGRDGDLGVIAEDTATGGPIGAAWLRLWTKDNHGYGFVDTETPELLVAIRRGHRGKGVGTSLMNELLRTTRSRCRAVSLSVWPENPAKRLYFRLGFEIVGRHGRAWTMLRNFE